MVMALGMAGIVVRLTFPEADFHPTVEGRRVTLQAYEGPGYQYRWDFDGDRRWDTQWSEERQAEHRFKKAGRYTVRLEVKSPLGTSSSEHAVRIAGGQARRGKAKKVAE
jgi:PKD repeat protein